MQQRINTYKIYFRNNNTILFIFDKSKYDIRVEQES